MDFSSYLNLSEENRKYLQEVFQRNFNIDELKIIEEKLPPEKCLERSIRAEDMEFKSDPRNNELVIPVHNDRWYVGETYMPPGGLKFLTYRVFRLPLGLLEIEIKAGELIRSEKMKIESYGRVDRKKYCYVYMEDIGQYKEYKEIKSKDEPDSLNDKQKFALSRLEETEELFTLFSGFLLAFSQYLPKFRYTPVVSEPKHIIKCISDYERMLTYCLFYTKIQFVMGAISKSETTILLNKAKDVYELVSRLKEEWQGLKKDDIEERFRAIEHNAQAFILPRKEDITAEYYKLSEGADKRKAEGVLIVIGGHIFENGVLCPSILEVERRKDLYEDWSTIDQEERFYKLLKEALQAK